MPVNTLANVAGAILVLIALRGRRIGVGLVLRGAPWHIVVFSLGMYLEVYGLRNAGLTDYLAGWLNAGAQESV